MMSRFRAWEIGPVRDGSRPGRQFVVAVTANGAQLGRGSFDEMCAKPLTAADIVRVVQRYLNARLA
jgi:hypothetical protein